MAAEARTLADSEALVRLDNKSALIVGGYGGIGKLTTQLLSDYGAAVAIAGRSEDQAQSLAKELTQQSTLR